MSDSETRRPTADAILSTRDVARRLVVSEATVKRWADDGLLPCYRTPGGHRKFTVADLERFMQSRGFAGVARVPEASAGEALRLASDGDVAALEAMAHAALDGGLAVEAFCDTVVAPALVEIGDRWACADATVADEHVVSQSMVGLLARLRARLDRAPLHGGLALVACAAGERHDIASRMLGIVLRSRGWATLDVGADVPTDDLARLTRSRGARLVTLSASVAEVGTVSALASLQRFFDLAGTDRPRVFAGGSAYESGRLPAGVETARDCREFANRLDLRPAR